MLVVNDHQPSSQILPCVIADPTPEVVDQAGDEIQYLNDAELLGESTDEMQALLKKPFKFTLGHLYEDPSKKFRNKDDWRTSEMPLLHWLAGKGAEGKRDAWGLSRHPVGKAKDGASIVLGSLVGGSGERKDAAIEEMHAIGIDVDSGASLDDVIDKLEELGLFAIVYTSWNNGKTVLEIKHDDVVKKLKLDSSPDIHQVREYLTAHHKDRFDAEFLAGVEIVEARKQTKDGVKVILSTPPLDKMRIIFPLAEAVKLADLAPTLNGWKDAWADKVCGVAQNILGVSFDATSCDVNRFYYTARHAEGAENWHSAIIQGKPLHFDDIKPYSKAKYVKERKLDQSDPWASSATCDTVETKLYLTPSGKKLNEWYKISKDRWLIADVIEQYCEDKIRGNPATGKVEIECPFEHDHSKEGGTACMVQNPTESTEEIWGWFCHHDVCQGRSKLEFLEEALRAEWFPEDVLYADEFLLDADELEVADSSKIAAARDGDLTYEDVATNAAVKACLEAVGIYEDASDTEVLALLRRAVEVADQSSRNRLTAALVDATSLTANNIKVLWKTIDDEHRDKLTKEGMAAVARQREDQKAADFVLLSEATAQTVRAAAEVATWLPLSYAYKDGGFYLINFEDRQKDKWICDAFEVVGINYGEDADQMHCTIRFMHRSHQIIGVNEVTIDVGDLWGESVSVIKKLTTAGLKINPQGGSNANTDSAVGSLLFLLRAIDTDREAIIRPIPGWTEDRESFVSPTGEVLTNGNIRYVLDEKMRIKSGRAGALEDWKSNIATACMGTNGEFYTMGVLSGFVGCVAQYIDFPQSPVAAFEQNSSKGKTTALIAGVSVWTKPDHTGLLFKADFTATAAETVAAMGTGTVVALDDQGTSTNDAEQLQRLILQWSEGQGRGRGRQDGSLRQQASWHTCFTLSAEQSFVSAIEMQKAAKHGNVDVKSGAVARVLTIDYGDVKDLNKCGAADAGTILKAYDFINRGGSYGHAGPLFVKELIRRGVDDVSEHFEQIVDELKQDCGSTEMRIIRTAGLFIVAGEIAQDIGLLPEDLSVFELVEGRTLASIERRAGHINTDEQTLENLRVAITKGLACKTIQDRFNEEDVGREVQGWWGHFHGVGKMDKEAYAAEDASDDDESRSLAQCKRTYILPVRCLAEMGIKADAETVARLLNERGDLFEPSPKSKFASKGFWEGAPGSKREPTIRIHGRLVHGGV